MLTHLAQRVSSGARVPAGNINGDWTHDLHNPTQDGRRPRAQQPAPNSLAARVHAPGTTLPKTRPGAQNTRSNRTNKLANAFTRAAASSNNAQQMNVVDSHDGRGITIKGLAGPFAVLAQNFAPGTTAADIESALTPVGGLISSCRLVKTYPIVIAEIVFESKEGADRVIERFDKQTVSLIAPPLYGSMKTGTDKRATFLGRRPNIKCLREAWWLHSTPSRSRVPEHQRYPACGQ